jgi:GNAT superfamily N-acetyltransferase
VARGAVEHDAVGVLARDLAAGLGHLPPAGPEVRSELVRDERTLRDARTVFREVWGGPEPSPEQHERDLAEAALPVGEREAFQVVAYVDDEPASAGGCTRTGDVARLWGAATRPAYRGRGAYRETVRARLELAVQHGATLGLVKGRLATSGPILTRLGFTSYGEEPLLALDL